ncbi:hypothetical protein JG688_00014232 [Phytophthora aleatoria]|uniref:Uncharacterized protein n=1 Tax=Phytophthora aleatoria TaxID=2496075 RepID=A0A8J5IG86_9STRA|nr:hypothetical protein JG688_00014232 [Phytophthora aleatoria]
MWKKRILLFQTAVNSRYPVNGKGIIPVLNKLELLGKALTNPKSVRLIFAVSRPQGTRMEDKQTVQSESLADSENVDCISIVGPVEMNQLRAINVWTVRYLRRAVDVPLAQYRAFFSLEVLAQYATILENFDERQSSIESMLTNIPQYVWEL